MQLPKMLIVDDEPTNRGYLRRAFRNRYQVFEAEDGAAALSLLQGQSVDVLITDNKMPNLTGLELLEKAQELVPQALKVVVSAYDDPQDIIRAINTGKISLYLKKPVPLRELERVNELLPALLSAASEVQIDEREVVALQQVANEMADGNFDVSAPPPTGKRPVDELGNTLNRLATRVREKTGELQQLVELGDQINSGVLVDEILDHIYDSFRQLLPYDRIGFATLVDDGKRVCATWAKSNAGELALGAGFSASLEGSSLQPLLEHREPRILNDLEGYLREHPASESTQLVVREGMRSSLTLPLWAFNRPVGFLFLSSRTPHTYHDEHVDIFRRVATQLSGAIERARLYEAAMHTNNELSDANDELALIAALDPLTGVANRRAFERHAVLQWKSAARNSSSICLLMIDIDHFKRFNDSRGHLAGDACLSAVAGVLQRCLRRPGDLVGRYGGEEFVVVLPETTSVGGQVVGESMRSKLTELGLDHPDSPTSGNVTMSIGVAAAIPGEVSDLDTLLSRADRTMYAAKHQGRDRVVIAAGDDSDSPKQDKQDALAG